tara:strand:- start:42 stop:320 length:279 start_codon:yes stop_codon:yes gene_type:complete
MNAQIIWKFFEGRPITSTLVFGIPSGIVFVYAWQMSSSVMGSWGSRFLAFAASFIAWPILNWVLLGESFFTPKVLICVLLSFLIVLAQVYMP